MAFRDEVMINVYAGKGGNGISSFRREKYIPFGGPDGGSGAIGGAVYIVASESIRDLNSFRKNAKYRAKDGGRGQSYNKTGKRGEDLYLKVPVGTEVYDYESKILICDMDCDGKTILVAKGGIGGSGNSVFKSSVNRAPMNASEGQDGEFRSLMLIQKIFADIAMIGKPNAGKSTMFSLITKAYSKVGDYPFTTIDPVLGKVDFISNCAIIADIPGLIKGASQGKGLGLNFLKHIERCSALFHFIEGCSDDFLSDYCEIINEIKGYDKGKKRILVVTKSDLLDARQKKEIDSIFEKEIKKDGYLSIIYTSKEDATSIDNMLELIKNIIGNFKSKPFKIELGYK